MAITVDWKNKIINVPKADMTLIQSVPTEIRQLDLDVFRLRLKDLEDDADGMTFLDTHRHNTTVTVGGAILARVIEIINGYTVTFEDDQYAVNLVGANSNVGDVVNVNQVSVRSANSAGLQDLNSLQASSFAGGVAIDPTSSNSGTTFPIGTRAYPVNNITDAKAIADARGLKQIYVASALTLSSIDLSNRYIFIGNSIHTPITINTSANTTQCEFRNLTVTGTIDSGTLLRECAVDDIVLVDGSLFFCAVLGDIAVSGSTQCTLLDCYSAIPDVAPAVTLDLTSVSPGHVLIVRGWKGDLKLANCSSAIYADIGMSSGHAEIASTITAGNFSFYNGAVVEDFSTGTAVIEDHTIFTHVPARTWNSSITEHSQAGTFAEKIRKNLIR